VTVETAVALPILFVVTFAAFEFCRANMLWHTAGNAAYEGAREGITPGATVDKMKATATSVLATVGADGAVITTQPTQITDETKEVTVTIQIPVDKNGYLTSVFFRDRWVSGTCTLSREQVD
jgi:Flp pilus assembly protein TadG